MNKLLSQSSILILNEYKSAYFLVFDMANDYIIFIFHYIIIPNKNHSLR